MLGPLGMGLKKSEMVAETGRDLDLSMNFCVMPSGSWGDAGWGDASWGDAGWGNASWGGDTKVGSFAVETLVEAEGTGSGR